MRIDTFFSPSKGGNPACNVLSTVIILDDIRRVIDVILRFPTETP